MKDLIRGFLNKRNYEIIKKNYRGNKYPNLSNHSNEYYCETPIGKYYVPIEYEKDAVASELVRGNVFEPEIIEAAKIYIKTGSTVIDMGANFGQMSMAFSKLVGVEGKVYSIEAQNVVFNFLKKNVEANNCKNINLIERAAYNEDNKIVYFPTVDLSETSAFKTAPYSGNALISNESGGIPVKTITIDSLQILSPVSFIKVDVQGADLFAMQGAKQTILKHKPAIILEFEQPVQDEFKTSLNDYVEFVREINYKFVKT
ncbi:MAG: FkbM family methyltransferase, partial [Ferruginibacter sp.]